MTTATATATTKPLRVMHVITRLVRGGAQGVMLDMLAGLEPSRFDLTLVAGQETGSEGSLWDEARQLGIPIHVLPALVRDVSPLKDIQAYWQLRRLLREVKPDVVHSHTSKAGLIGSIAARHENVGCVILAPHGHILGDGAGIPGVPSGGMKRWLLSAAQKQSCNHADLVIAPNDSELADGIRLGLWNSRTSATVPNGIDTDRFHPDRKRDCRTRLDYQTDIYRVGVIARLTTEKGLDTALQAIAFLDDAHLVVCGDGPERDSLERMVATLGISNRVEFLGMVDDIAGVIPALDACIVPSRTEAHGMVAAEALACEVPVVASDVGGLRSLVLPEQTGLLVDVGNVGGFAAAITRLRNDPALARMLASSGRKHIVENYSRQVMIDRLSDIYVDYAGIPLGRNK